MDPHGPIARRFPLVARFRPACLPLPDRVQALVDLADRAAQENAPGLASSVLNQSALLASDLGVPDLARTMCHRHANAYLQACPLSGTDAIRGLEPLVNLARLQIRAGHPDDGRQRLLDLYEAVGSSGSVAFEGIEVPGTLTRTAEDRREVEAWLWRVVLADGTRTLTTTGCWREALTHIEEHRGVGTRMLDGRQVAVIAALTEGDTDRASQLLNSTVPGDPWEQVVTDSLNALCRQYAGRDTVRCLDVLIDDYRKREAGHGLTVFDVRLGLTVLDVSASAQHPNSISLVEDLAHRTATARDGYAAREVVADHPFVVLATEQQTRECRDLVQACALESGSLPQEYAESVSAGLDTSEAVIRRSFFTGLA